MGGFIVVRGAVMAGFFSDLLQAVGDIFLNIIHALVHVLFFDDNVVLEVRFYLVSNFYHLFNGRCGFDRKDVVEGGSCGVAGFSVENCLDLALELLFAIVKEGNEALLTVVDGLSQID